MFDTVRGEVRCELDPGRLLRAGFHRHVDEKLDHEGGLVEVVRYELHLKGESPHYLGYLPPKESDVQDPAGHLKVETSLPKVLRGENVTLLSPDDVQRSFDVVSNRICDKVGDVGEFGDFDVRGRMDAVYSWGTCHGDDYLHALKQMNLGRHVLESVDRDATVYWRNRQRVIRAYDKFKECGLEIAKDQLRFEVQLNHAKNELGRLAGVTSMKMRDVVNWETAKSVLRWYLLALGGDLMIADDEKLLEGLLKNCGGARAQRLFGAVMMQRLYSRDELVRRGVARATFYRSRSEIRAIGVSEGSVRSGILPPLRLPDDYTGEPLKLD